MCIHLVRNVDNMSRLSRVFLNSSKNHKVFIPFITAGDSGLDNTFELMQVLVKNGADVIELGVPFSDPMADGPVISRSYERAVKDGVSLFDVFTVVKKFRQINDTTAIVLMGYLNPIEVFGYQSFANAASESGVDGVLVVDMPPEEAYGLKQILDGVGINFIFLVAPTTMDERLVFLATIALRLYLFCFKGVTGAEYLDINLVKTYILRIRQAIDLPIGVGFGIKDAISAKMVAEYADAVIVGSSLVVLVERYANDRTKMLTSVGYLANEISTIIK